MRRSFAINWAWSHRGSRTCSRLRLKQGSGIAWSPISMGSAKGSGMLIAGWQKRSNPRLAGQAKSDAVADRVRADRANGTVRLSQHRHTEPSGLVDIGRVAY
jgi:hypothetical protein